jgi:hypothetical protein
MDKNYWASLPYPLSPSDDDVKEYKRLMMRGTTLMLGCTQKLIPLSNRQLDIDPWYQAETVIKGDWLENKHFYTNIIIDGGLCFNKELCDGILEMASKNCRKFISRSFDHRLDSMKVADYFPGVMDFNPLPKYWYHTTGNDYTFYEWEF